MRKYQISALFYFILFYYTHRCASERTYLERIALIIAVLGCDLTNLMKWNFQKINEATRSP